MTNFGNLNQNQLATVPYLKLFIGVHSIIYGKWNHSSNECIQYSRMEETKWKQDSQAEKA